MPEYLQHGRRHGPQGSDPIPGVGNGMPTMYAAGFLSSFLASNVTATTIPISSIFAGFSDAAVFAINSGTDEFEIITDGVYLATLSVAMGIGAVPAADAYASVAFNMTDDHGAGLLEGNIQPWANLTQVALGGSIPLNIDSGSTRSGIQIAQTSGHTADVHVELLVVQFNSNPLTLS